MSWLKDIPEVHRDKVKLLILENFDLRERLRLERIEKYGPAAEGLTDANRLKKMKVGFSTNDLIHIQVASRLSDLLFDEKERPYQRRHGRVTSAPFYDVRVNSQSKSHFRVRIVVRCYVD